MINDNNQEGPADQNTEMNRVNRDGSVLPNGDNREGSVLPNGDKGNGSVLPNGDEGDGSVLPNGDNGDGSVLSNGEKLVVFVQQSDNPVGDTQKSGLSD